MTVCPRGLRAFGALAAACIATAGLAAVAPQGAQSGAPPIATPTFLGVDRFDNPRLLGDFEDLEAQVKDVAARVRPTVVLLQARGGRGGMSSGTGVIIGSDGLVATCGHVGVRPGRAVEATLADGTRLKGTTLGQAFRGGVDCGLVQLETNGRELPAAPIGSIVGLAKGDWLLALGHTHGADEGPRPALLRVGRVLGTAPHQLLFDAPIDAGDSGGPSFNLRGEVVGLNSRCGRPSWENIATPIDDLVERMDELKSQTTDSGGGEQSSRRRSRPTIFPSGVSDSGKLAAQRAVRYLPVLEDARQVLLRVISAGDVLCYGTVVDKRGLALTKASHVEGLAEFEVESAKHERFPARVVAVDRESDLALVLIEGVHTGDLAEVKWYIEPSTAPGTALITPRWRPEHAALGFSAIEERVNGQDAMSRPYIGLRTAVADAESLEALSVQQGVRVQEVVPSAGASKAGILTGDILLLLGGKQVRSPESLRRLISERKIGERVEVEIAREGERRTMEVTLSERPQSMGGTSKRGNTTTPISRVSSDLGGVLPHDAIILPEQVGGPVVDLQGRVVGINIARFDRTATHAIPAARAEAVVRALTQQARQARESATPSGAP